MILSNQATTLTTVHVFIKTKFPPFTSDVWNVSSEWDTDVGGDQRKNG